MSDNDQLLNSIPYAVFTENESRRQHICPFFPALITPNGDLRFINCRGPECMAWRWSAHFKIENREPRPTGYCGRVEAAPTAGEFEAKTILDVLPDPTAPSPIIQQ